MTQVEAPSSVVQVSGAGRRFSDFAALDDISLSIESGQVFGLIGPSGSGKTTLVKLILGILTASEGSVRLWGVPSEALGLREKRLVGYMPQEFSLYPSLSALENARFMASVYGVGWLQRRQRIRDILSFLEIWDARRRLAQDLSGGMRRRLAMACALIHRPRFLVVDEPTAGLDPDLRERIWQLLREIRDRGTTILMTTQYLEEAERCDSVAILSEGRLAASGTPDELRLKANLPDVIEIEALGLTREVAESILRLDGVHGVQWNRGRLLRVSANDQAATQVEVNKILNENGCEILRVQGNRATFDEVFSSLVSPERA
jgi:ABC-2 type transport system ATP-binding protein